MTLSTCQELYVYVDNTDLVVFSASAIKIEFAATKFHPLFSAVKGHDSN
jgi:hypothetical protein